MSESVMEVFHAILKKNNIITIYPKETHIYLKYLKKIKI